MNGADERDADTAFGQRHQRSRASALRGGKADREQVDGGDRQNENKNNCRDDGHAWLADARFGYLPTESRDARMTGTSAVAL